MYWRSFRTFIFLFCIILRINQPVRPRKKNINWYWPGSFKYPPFHCSPFISDRRRNSRPPAWINTPDLRLLWSSRPHHPHHWAERRRKRCLTMDGYSGEKEGRGTWWRSSCYAKNQEVRAHTQKHTHRHIWETQTRGSLGWDEWKRRCQRDAAEADRGMLTAHTPTHPHVHTHTSTHYTHPKQRVWQRAARALCSHEEEMFLTSILVSAEQTRDRLVRKWSHPDLRETSACLHLPEQPVSCGCREQWVHILLRCCKL